MQINEIIDGFRFKTITQQDKDRFMSVRMESSDIAFMYKAYPDYVNYSWEMLLTDANVLNMVVFLFPKDQFVATCSIQKLQSNAVELGYDVVRELRGRGIGTQMVTALIKLGHEHFPEREILIKVRRENAASRHVAEKCGGILLRLEDAPETVALQTLLDMNAEFTSADRAKATVERGRNSVLVYQV